MHVNNFQQFLGKLCRIKSRTDFRNHFIFTLYLHGVIVALFILFWGLAQTFGYEGFRLPGFTLTLLLFAFAGAISLSVTCLRAVMEKPGLIDVARMVDSRLRLKDRLTTAAELVYQNPEHPFRDAVVRDAQYLAESNLKSLRGDLFPKRKWLNPWMGFVVFCWIFVLFPDAFKRSLRALSWDRVPPRIEFIEPENGKRGVWPSNILIRFSEEVDPASIDSEKGLMLREADSETKVPGNFKAVGSNRMFEFVPAVPGQKLEADCLYAIFISTLIRDYAGNYLETESGQPGRDEHIVSTFSTPAPLPNLWLEVLAVEPVNGERGVATDIQPSVIFNRAILPSSLTPENIFLREVDNDEPVPADIFFSPYNQDRDCVYIKPRETLKPGTLYAIVITDGLKPDTLFQNTAWDGGSEVFTFVTKDDGEGSSLPEEFGGIQPFIPAEPLPLPLPFETSGASGNPKMPDTKKPQEPKAPEDVERDGGDGAGNSHDPNPAGKDDGKDPKAEIVKKNTKSLLDEAGIFNEYKEKMKLSDKPDPEKPEDPPARLLDFKEVFKEYDQLAKERLEHRDLPAFYKSFVQKYFEAIAPAEK